MLNSMKTMLISMALLAVAQATPLRGDYFWAAKAGEVTQEMGRYARLALEHSHDPSVLAHARKVDAESRADFQRLARLAETREMPMATGPTTAQENEFHALALLQGSSFDQAYWKKQQDSLTALNLCRNQALARSHDAALSQALNGLEIEAAGR